MHEENISKLITGNGNKHGNLSRARKDILLIAGTFLFDAVSYVLISQCEDNIFHGLFNETFSIATIQRRMVAWHMNNKVKIIWKEVAVAETKYYSGICLQGLKKITRHLSHNSRCLGRSSNQAPLEDDNITRNRV
jgi:hypothetical protein